MHLHRETIVHGGSQKKIIIIVITELISDSIVLI